LADDVHSYQNEEAVGGEVLMSRDGGEHRKDQAAEHQHKPKQNNRNTSIQHTHKTVMTSMA